MSNAVAIPPLAPLATAIALLALTGRPRAQQRLSLASGALLLVTCGWLLERTLGRGEILVLRIGDWAPAIGVVWVADGLSAIMLALAAVTSGAMLLYAPASLRGAGERRWFYPLHQLLLSGVNGAFATGDLFNLFVFFEVLLLASFALMALGTRPRQLARAFPYVLLNLVASATFLAGVGAVYATIGTVNLAEIGRSVAARPQTGTFWAAMALVLSVFAIKAALAPVFFWLPDSYPEAPLAISGLFAGLLTKVGVYALFRAVPLVAAPGSPIARALLVVAGATMLVGVLGALGRGSIRAILSFHVVSQVGYMVFGLALLTPVAVAAGLFFVAHQIVVKTAVFFAGGIVERMAGTGELGAVRGIARTHPWVAASFFVPAMSLAGLPPLSGFWGKLMLVVAGFRAGAFAVTSVSLLVSLLTLASMLKIWAAVFWGEPRGVTRPWMGRDPGMLAGTLALGAISVGIGLGAAALAPWVEAAANGVVEKAPYLDAVLGTGAIPGAGGTR